MLTLHAIAEELPFTLQADEYLPLKVDFPPPLTSVDDIYYWRSRSSRHLLEVGLAAATGAINTITLVLVPPAWKLHAPSIQGLCEAASRKQGLPVFHLDPWKEKGGLKKTGGDQAIRIHEENVSFKLHIAADGVALLFDNCSPSCLVINNGLRFCFNAANEWCGLIVER
jgi:hypothetical protein